MMQLIVPQIVRKYCTCIITILQIIILFEYLYYFIKVNIGNKINPDFIQLFLDDNPRNLEKKTLEINLLFTLYCYFIQKVNYTNSIYKNEKLDFETFILSKFQQLKVLKFIQEIYVWILFVLTFFTITWFYQLFFFLKLCSFSLLFYKFLNLKDLKSIKKYIWLFILYCGLNTFLIYMYQFKVLVLLQPYFDDLAKSFPDYIIKNLTIIGLEIYNDKDLPLKLLPHYVSNFLSVLILWEISRICDQNTEENTDEFYKKMRLSFNYNDISNANANLNNTRISNANANNLDRSSQLGNFKKRKFEEKKKYKSIGYYKFIFVLLNFAFYLCRLYWLFTYATICLIFSAISFSFSIIIYIFLVTSCFILLFKNILAYLKNSERNEYKFHYLQTIKYPFEKRKINQLINEYRKLSFKLILFNALLFISMTYLYTLLDFVQT